MRFLSQSEGDIEISKVLREILNGHTPAFPNLELPVVKDQ
jgi:hypothetical protein